MTTAESIVRDIFLAGARKFLEDEQFEDFLKAKKKKPSDLMKYILEFEPEVPVAAPKRTVAKKPGKGDLSADELRERLDPSWDDNWPKSDGFCLTYFGARGDKEGNHKYEFHGAKTAKNVCAECMNGAAGKTLYKLIRGGEFKRSEYRDQKRKSRFAGIRKKLKDMGESEEGKLIKKGNAKTNNTVFTVCAYDHDKKLRRNEDYGFLIKQTEDKFGKRIQTVVGKDEDDDGSCQLLDLDDLEKIFKSDAQIDPNALSEDALEAYEKRQNMKKKLTGGRTLNTDSSSDDESEEESAKKKPEKKAEKDFSDSSSSSAEEPKKDTKKPASKVVPKKNNKASSSSSSVEEPKKDTKKAVSKVVPKKNNKASSSSSSVEEPKKDIKKPLTKSSSKAADSETDKSSDSKKNNKKPETKKGGKASSSSSSVEEPKKDAKKPASKVVPKKNNKASSSSSSVEEPKKDNKKPLTKSSPKTVESETDKSAEKSSDSKKNNKASLGSEEEVEKPVEKSAEEKNDLPEEKIVETEN